MSTLYPKRVPTFLGHILDSISKIEQYVAGLDVAAFDKSQLVQDAVIWNFRIIGEASNRIVKNDPTFQERHPEFPLHLAFGMRNALAAGYDRVIARTVWNAIQSDLPRLKEEVVSIQESGA